MPATYEKLGIRFQYPDNWTLDETEALEGNQSVSVVSPGGSFWSVMIRSREAQPLQLADAALAAMQAQYDELDAERADERLGGRELVGYDIYFYCLDLTNTAQVRSYQDDRASYVVFCQADDREYAELEQVFRAITLSLLS